MVGVLVSGNVDGSVDIVEEVSRARMPLLMVDDEREQESGLYKCYPVCGRAGLPRTGDARAPSEEGSQPIIGRQAMRRDTALSSLHMINLHRFTGHEQLLSGATARWVS